MDNGDVSGTGRGGLFAGLFDRGAAGTGDEAWLAAMLDTEAALARALERAGLAAEGAGAAVTAAARPGAFDPGELGRQAAGAGNPVPALVRALTAMVPPEAKAAVHQGATSQDILDTAVMLMARRALDVVLADLSAAAAAAAALAEAHRNTVMTGRTLLQQAVPVTFGLVAAGWLTGIDEARQGLDRIRHQRLAVQFGGAAGTLASLGDDGPRVRALLAEELGLALPRCCPGIPTGCGSSSWPRRSPERAASSARWPGTSPCSPSPRWQRCARGRAARPGQAGGAARRPCPTSATRSPRS